MRSDSRHAFTHSRIHAHFSVEEPHLSVLSSESSFPIEEASFLYENAPDSRYAPPLQPAQAQATSPVRDIPPHR